MTDDVGLLQHARFDVPNRCCGYCTDDVGRAVVVAALAARHDETREAALRLFPIYLAFLADAQLHDGWFHDFMGYDRRWQDDRGGEDGFGRAVWGLGYAAAHAPRATWRRLAAQLLHAALPHVAALVYVRPRAYVALGLTEVAAAGPSDAPVRSALANVVEPLGAAYRAHATPAWHWCETTMSYDNARLCEALVRAGRVLQRTELVVAGCAMLDYYANLTLENGTFVPIGNAGWFAPGAPRPRYAQQPLEAAALVGASLAALDATGDERYRPLAEAGYDWFFGRNTLGLTLVAEGACHDGLEADGVNENMGAESTLAFLMSAFSMVEAAKRITLPRTLRVPK